jgi:small-conductance mechanosensitive channel
MCLPTDYALANESADGKQRSSRVRHVIDDDEPHVTFRPEDEVHVVSTALSCLKSRQERHQMWYNKDDIKEFRREAQRLSKRFRDAPQSYVDDDHTRGLELRSSLQRQNRKQMIVKRILEAQQEASTPEDLARIAQQHSEWARKLALAQAHKDYYSAYHPTLSPILPVMPALLDCSRDLISNNKRPFLLGASLKHTTGRRVRCRMF